MRNYNPIVYLKSEGNFETFTGYLGSKSNKSTKKIIWDSETPAVGGRQRSCDVTNNNPRTLRGKALRIETIHNAFSCFFDDKMFELLLTETNKKIREKLITLSRCKEHLFESSKNPYLKQTSLE